MMIKNDVHSLAATNTTNTLLMHIVLSQNTHHMQKRTLYEYNTCI